jgi:hypothetical protein
MVWGAVIAAIIAALVSAANLVVTLRRDADEHKREREMARLAELRAAAASLVGAAHEVGEQTEAVARASDGRVSGNLPTPVEDPHSHVRLAYQMVCLATRSEDVQARARHVMTISWHVRERKEGRPSGRIPREMPAPKVVRAVTQPFLEAVRRELDIDHQLLSETTVVREVHRIERNEEPWASLEKS